MATNGVAGEQIDYDINVSNDRAVDCGTRSISDRLPDWHDVRERDRQPVTAGDCAENGGVVSCELGVVEVNEDVTIRLVVAVESWVVAGATITNQATGTTATPQADTSNDDGSAAVSIARVADIGIVKTAVPAGVAAGDDGQLGNRDDQLRSVGRHQCRSGGRVPGRVLGDLDHRYPRCVQPDGHRARLHPANAR